MFTTMKFACEFWDIVSVDRVSDVSGNEQKEELFTH